MQLPLSSIMFPFRNSLYLPIRLLHSVHLLKCVPISMSISLLFILVIFVGVCVLSLK